MIQMDNPRKIGSTGSRSTSTRRQLQTQPKVGANWPAVNFLKVADSIDQGVPQAERNTTCIDRSSSFANCSSSSCPWSALDHQQEISHHLCSFRMIMRAEFAQSDNDIETRLVRTKVARELLTTVGGNGASTKRTAAGRHGTGELHVSSRVWTLLHYGTWRESQAWITVLWNSLTQMNLQICADMLGVDISPNIWRQLPIGGAPHSHCNGGILRVRHLGLLLSNGTPCLQQDRLWLECTTQGRGRRKA